MTDKERLERIIQMQYDGYTIWDMGENDLIWLIKQAGRVQELETTVDFYQSALRDADRRVQELEEELYGNDIQMRYKRMYGACNRDYAKLLQQNKRYREVINNINEKAMLYGVNEQVFEAIKEAIRVLEGEE